ncbi:transglutaminase [Aureimonas endophytica]|uniref:Transglutaminase n=1 Tax=Aureimonas endophytica TaxID=2027858 RepID=A0A917A0K6_9HYPH|nr:transglutaminase family protein [Aureimonas endophytica]GGE20825.1 transglutaminase [Aureimonas endophytica]
MSGSDGPVLYDLRLRIAADYPSTVKEARHILRMRPRRRANQEVLGETLRLTPAPDEMRGVADFFGNACDHVAILKQHEMLDADLVARVRVAPTAFDPAGAPSLAETAEAARTSRETGATAPVHFRGASRLLRPSPAIMDFGRDFAAAPNVAEAALAMTKAIHAGFTYASGETGIDTPVETVLRTRRGVCQDFAHLMIAALRGLGLPAAYVSGFLRTEPPPGRPRLAGADAMHAWVAVWLGPSLGWREFDPTNGVAANVDHLVVAIGRDYADVAPMGGVVTTSGGQMARHEVDMVPVEDAEALADKPAGAVNELVRQTR